MANGWMLPLPLFADSSDEPVFMALGRAINRWEHIEFSLAQMYSLFVGDESLRKMREYGAPSIFRDRLAGLQHAAEAWFIKNPSQGHEGTFDKLTTAARGFSDRRNEFAHGLVLNVTEHIFWRVHLRLHAPDTERYLVVPALHTVRKYDRHWQPLFGYSSYELDILSERMSNLEGELDYLAFTIWPNAWLPPEQ
ncbi:hypothetical protein [Mesorhizobium marinum]|uniref:hypothetical protein n=1 Tax=Mesorhizobium marinum TaxID=3228790 RepID=UPI003465A9F7